MSVSRVLSVTQRELAMGLAEPDAYARYSGGRQEPWCAHFASWVFAQAGKPWPYYQAPSPSVANPMAATTYAWTVFSQLGMVRRQPRPGDLVFYRKNEGGVLSQTKMGHVGIVTSVDGSTVVSVEGNLSDRVMQVRHALTDPSIAGYARPVVGSGGLGLVLVAAGAAAAGFIVLRRRAGAA